MYACNGILFNHESPRRGETFVTRKITRGLADIVQGLETLLAFAVFNRRRGLVLIGLVSFVTLCEFAQYFTATRQARVDDIGYSLLGVIAASVIFCFAKKKMTHPVTDA